MTQFTVEDIDKAIQELKQQAAEINRRVQEVTQDKTDPNLDLSWIKESVKKEK